MEGWVREVAEELRKLIGKRVVGFAVGEDGFDLEFCDGTVLELYVFPDEVCREAGVDPETIERAGCWGIWVGRPDEELAPNKQQG